MIIHLNETDTLDVLVSDDSYRYRTIMGEETISLTFNLPEHVEIPIGAYVEYQGETYTLNSPQNLRKNSTRNFEYTMILEAPKGALTKYRIKDTSNRLKFSLTAKPHEFLQLIVDNMNQRESGWIAGDYIESNEKVVTFSHNTCAEALQMVAEAFDTEYEISGKTIHLKKIEYNKESPLALSYGKGNGFLTGVRRENRDYRTRAIERLYVQGGSRNIDPSKYNNVSELLLPKNQTITTPDGRIYQTDADGYSITRADKPLATNEEGSLDCSYIYPNREGEVTEVITVDAAGNLYDIKDTTIPEGLDYTACLIEGEKMSLIFQTGMLAGKEFDVNYNHADRKFEIEWQDIDGQKMPNETFKPAVNDKYRVFNIHMPQAYISDNTKKTGASWDMFRKAVEYFSENEVPQFSFIGDLDPIWAKQNWLNIGGKIRLGGYVNFTDQQFQQDSALVRITGVKDYINRPYAPQIELSNAPVGVSISSYLGKIETTPVVIEQSKKDSINYTKRSYRDARETMEMLAAAISNYSGAINPITIQTMQALVGDESLQFRFVNGTTNPVVSNPTIEINTSKQLSISACIIQHMTLGITELKSQHADADYKFWNMPAYLSAPLTEPDKSYYLYAKASKSTATGEFILSETPIAMEQVTGFYHLLTLLIGKEYQGEREITTLWGFTEILPGRVTTDRIVSQDGKTYIDLVNNIIKGNISFKSGETYTDVGAGIAGAIATAAADATDKADAAIGEAQGYTDTVKAGLQAQIDGVVDSWFYSYSPTTANYPASDWTTTELKQRHVGDTFTNTQPFVDNATTPDAGKSWRWVENAGVFSWTQIADSDAVIALQRAAQAQDTADGKRRVFTAQPVTPYNVGDLWSQGAAGDLMKCKTERLTGSYNSADWEKASKYTDDTAANEAYNYADEAYMEAMSAQQSAANAQASANTANSLLTNIASDSKLTPDEKQATKKEWDVIVSEYTPILNQGTAFGITTEKTAFTTKYNALSAYITPLLSSLTTTSDITGSVFRSTFAEYYTAKVNLLNAISTKAKQIADAAQSDADQAWAYADDVQNELNGLQVGGENIASRTDIQIAAGANNYALEIIKGSNLPSPPDGSLLKNNQQYVLTVSYSSKSAGTATQYTVLLYDYTTSTDGFSQLVPISSAKQVVKFTTPATGNWSLLVYAGVAGATAGNTVEYKGIMLQEGNRETAYQSAVKYLTQAIEGSTEISGGLVATNIMLLKNALEQITGGLSGIDDDNIGFWTGGTYADALANIAKIILRKDGSGQLAGGNVHWDNAGNLHVEGIISNKYEKLYIPASGTLNVNNSPAFGTYFLKSGASNSGNINIDLSSSALLKEGSEFTFVVNNKKTMTGDTVLYTVKLTFIGTEILGFGLYQNSNTEINIFAGGFLSLSIVYFDGKFIVSNLVHKTGTLASGHVNSDGYHLFIWGEKALTGYAEIVSTGVYRVPIKMQQTRYMANLTAKESNRIVRFGVPSTNYFEVYVTDLNGNPASGGFVYSVFGDD